ncbi:hypothetical protein Pmani_011045 [Petrolisthes manimaculis]|uniref:Uncharacterized protein n=1 Tax=Petrolisthes manimaculis TaxID=1843537 RepID=A0AAE1Q0W2_9EUCA|nr:hypothetical protein Pmani_011045 [Petrolisthes manimaculis]
MAAIAASTQPQPLLTNHSPPSLLQYQPLTTPHALLRTLSDKKHLTRNRIREHTYSNTAQDLSRTHQQPKHQLH